MDVVVVVVVVVEQGCHGVDVVVFFKSFWHYMQRSNKVALKPIVSFQQLTRCC